MVINSNKKCVYIIAWNTVDQGHKVNTIEPIAVLLLSVIWYLDVIVMISDILRIFNETFLYKGIFSLVYLDF